MTDDDILDFIIDVEGRDFTDDPEDPGGATKFGITMPTLAADRGAPVTKDDMRALTEPQARELYGRRFIARFGMVGPAELRWLVVDCAVNHGPAVAIQMLQRALGIADDGVLGPSTTIAVQSKAFAWRKTFASILCERIILYDALIQKNVNQVKYAKGWDAKRVVPFVKALA